MDALKRTLFILAFVSVIAYTIRHIYFKWFEPTESVLDKYSDSSVEVKQATSIEQLDALYKEAHDKVTAYESDTTNPKIPWMERDETEPYKSEREIRTAIAGWEAKSREIFQIRFYWVVGFVLVVSGFALYKWANQWLGLTLIIVGFAEKVYWTSPTFIGSAGLEYDRLLTNKIIFSITTVILLLAVALLTNTLGPKKVSQEK